MKHYSWVLLALACAPVAAAPTSAPASNPPPLALGVAAPTATEYDRDQWGRWLDDDKDCQDTRQEVLIAESLDPVQLDAKGCRVVSGRWIDPYSGETVTNPAQLDIDHTVPVKVAYDDGGSAWPPEKRSAYFNTLTNPEHLIAVKLAGNRSKGAKRPSEWLPPNVKYRCQYLRDWITIKDRWSLNYTKEEALFLARSLALFCVSEPKKSPS